MIKNLATFRPSPVVPGVCTSTNWDIYESRWSREKNAKCDAPSKITSKVGKNTVDGQNPAPTGMVKPL